MAGLEGEVVFAGNRKKFRPLTHAPSMPNPIGKKPVIRTNPEMSMPGPLHCFSVNSLESLQNFSDRVKSRQPTIEIVHDANTGYILRDPDAELASQRLIFNPLQTISLRTRCLGYMQRATFNLFS